MAVCPVCKTECCEKSKCVVCGFSDVNRIFINREEAFQWEQTVLIPYRKAYFASISAEKTFKISSNKIIKYYKRSKAQRVFIPDYITKIAPGAFQFCDEIKEIYIPDSVTELPDSAFVGCGSLETIRLPNNLVKIPQYAFSGCDSLREIHITKGVYEISGSAFYGCKNLRKITLDPQNKNFVCKDNCLISNNGILILAGDNKLPQDGSINKIYGAVFHGLDFETLVIPEGVKEIESCMTANPLHGCDKMVSLILPNSLEYIGTLGISACAALKKIHIPKNVSQIMEGAFTHCDALSEITVDVENRTFISKNNCIIERSTKKLFLAVASSVIPNDGSVIGVDYRSYERVNSQNPVVIPKEIRSMDEEAFYSCNFDIYCEAKEKPVGWHENWNKWHQGTVFWGDDWHYENDLPVLNG